MKKKEVDIRIFYLVVHKYLDKIVTESRSIERIMSKLQFYGILGRVYHLPKKLWCCVLKEMEEMGMIEDLGSRRNYNIRINEIIRDPMEDANEIYQELGIFSFF